LFVKVLEIQRRVAGDRDEETLTTMGNLALLYWSEGKYSLAEPLSVRAVQLQRQVHGEEHPDTLTVMNNLALVYYSEGKYGEAEGLASGILDVKRRVLGEDHRDTLQTMSNLAGSTQPRENTPSPNPCASGYSKPNSAFSVANTRIRSQARTI
jgi:hypothetical protein